MWTWWAVRTWGSCWISYHMNIEEPSIGDAIRLAGDKLVAFHVGRITAAARAGPPGLGEIFGALKAVGYTGRIVAEPFVAVGGEVGRSVCSWRSLLEDTTEAALDAEAAYMLAFEKAMLKKWGL